MTRILYGLVLAALVTTPAAAQLTVHVVDGVGRPIPAVRVDVYGAGELITTATTSDRGTAELKLEGWAGVRRLSFSHLAYQTLIVQADDVPSDGVVRLEPAATKIEGFTVEGRALCPIQGEPGARRLWSEVASRYSRDTGNRAWSAYMSRYAGMVREGDLHDPPPAGAVDMVVAGHPWIIHGGDHEPRPLDERIRMEGYAWPPLMIAGTTGARSLAWGYPLLAREHAYHFATPVFGSLHDFAVASESEGQVTLIFCPNAEGRGATLSGTISLDPGERFLAAEWRFDTPDPDEGAGGAVVFTTYTEAGNDRPHLLASRGYFFRHSGKEPPYPDLPRSYSRFGTASIRWYLHPSDEHPCNEGLSFFGDPPTTPEGRRFGACIAAHWGSRSEAPGVPVHRQR